MHYPGGTAPSRPPPSYDPAANVALTSYSSQGSSRHPRGARIRGRDMNMAEFRRYLHRAVKRKQWDFDLIVGQLVNFLVKPKKAYQLTSYRHQSKGYWARDDPGFMVVVLALLTVTSICYATMFRATGWRLLFAALFPATASIAGGAAAAGFAAVGGPVLFSRLAAQLHPSFSAQSSHHHSFEDIDLADDEVGRGRGGTSGTFRESATENIADGPIPHIEWLYGLDLHFNALWVAALIGYILPFPLAPLLVHRQSIMSCLIGNTTEGIALLLYFKIVVLGYNKLPFCSNAGILFAPAVPLLCLLFLLAFFRVNVYRRLIAFTLFDL